MCSFGRGRESPLQWICRNHTWRGPYYPEALSVARVKAELDAVTRAEKLEKTGEREKRKREKEAKKMRKDAELVLSAATHGPNWKEERAKFFSRARLCKMNIENFQKIQRPMPEKRALARKKAAERM